MHTILEILTLSTDYLKKNGIAHARRQAEELLGEALKVGRMGLYVEHDRPLTELELDRCRSWLKRRATGEPLQHISGQVEFLDCVIKVSRAVLIPRQETEILADKIVQEISTQPLTDKVLWDVCCGSGCLGIALKKKMPELTVVLSDISPAALAVAKENAQLNQVDVEFLEGDLLNPFSGRKTDFIVCNPPYIAESELMGLDVEVRDYEPKTALVSGASGLEFYQRLANEMPNFLNKDGRVWLEIGSAQGMALKELFQGTTWRQSKLEQDWSGKDRFFSLEIE